MFFKASLNINARNTTSLDVIQIKWHAFFYVLLEFDALNYNPDER